MWAAIRKTRRFDSTKIQRQTRLSKDFVNPFIRSLVNGGFLVQENPGSGQIGPTYKLEKDVGIHRPMIDCDGKPLEPSSAQKMWRAIKVLRNFTFKDLSLSSDVSDDTARHYLKGLRRAGYLADHVQSEGSGLKTYNLIKSKDTGPRAPQVRADGSVYDHNTKKVVYRKASSK